MQDKDMDTNENKEGASAKEKRVMPSNVKPRASGGEQMRASGESRGTQRSDSRSMSFERTGRSISEGGRRAAHDAGEMAEDAKERLEGLYEDGRERIEGLYEGGRERLLDAYDRGYEAAREAYGWAEEHGRQALKQGGRRIKKSRRAVEGYFEENPLMIGAVGLGIGLILGALIPMSRRERDVYEPVSDELRDTAQRQSVDAIRSARRRAEDLGKEMSRDKRDPSRDF